MRDTKRGRLAAISTVLLLLGLAPGLALQSRPLTAHAATTADEAVTYQIDITHDGNQSTDAIAPPLTQMWSAPLGSALSYPLIADGRIYVIADNTGWSGKKLYALDPSSGQIAWGPIDLGGDTTAPNNPPEFAVLAYDNGEVFTAAFSGDVRAFDAGTGAQLWRVQLPYQLTTVTSPLVASNGVLYVTNGNGHPELFALSETDGHIIWQQLVSEGDNSAPAIGSTALYVSYECEDVTAMTVADASTLWHDTTNCFGGGGPTPVLYQGRLYVRSQWKTPEILDAGTGAVLGNFTSTAIPAFDSGLGFYLVGSTLTATTLSSGAAAWTFSGDGQLQSNPIVANGHVYIGSESGELYVLDESSGAVAWSGNLGAPIAKTGEAKFQMFSAPAIGEGILAVPLANGTLAVLRGPSTTVSGVTHQGAYTATSDASGAATDATAFRVGAGRSGRQAGTMAPPLQRLWSIDLGGTVGYPLIAGGRVFVTSASVSNADSLLSAFDRGSGARLWGPIDLGGGARTTAIAYDAGQVFALAPDGIVHAYSASTGTQNWTASLNNGYNWIFQMSPVASGGTLYASGAGRGGNGFAFNESNGSQRWTIPLASGGAQPVLGPRGVLFDDGCNDYYVSTSGTSIWPYDGGCTGGGPQPVASSHASRFFTGNRTLNEPDGSVAGYYSSGPPGAYDGSLAFYLVGPVLQAEDIATQRIVWSFTGDGQLVTAPLSINGVVYAGSASGAIYGLNETTGAALWSGSAGSALSGINYSWPLSDMNAGDDTLLVPAGNHLVAFGNAPAWSNWGSLGGQLTFGPAASANGTRIDALAPETDGSLWDYCCATASWQGQSLGGAPGAAASSVATSSRVDVFMRGRDLALWHTYWFAGKWWGWQSLGGKLADEPSAVNVSGLTEVFARGTDGHLWYWSNGAGWKLAGGTLAAAPSATTIAPGEFDALVEGTDHGLWWWSNVSGWHHAGGSLKDKPAAVSWGGGRIDGFVEGTDLSLWHWSNVAGWEHIGGRLAYRPAAVTWGSPRLDAFVIGADGALWHAWTAGAGWQWEPLAGQPQAGLSAVTEGANALDIFIRGTDGALWHRSYR